MTRIQDLVERAFLSYSDVHKQQLAVQAFCRGMQNQNMAQFGDVALERQCQC